MARTCHLICIGKLKSASLEDIEKSYLKRIKDFSLKIHELKARSEDPNWEAEEVIKKVMELSKGSKITTILLTENGKEYASEEFSHWLYQTALHDQGQVAFIIAGAEGPSAKLRAFCQYQLSLSKLTFPHKIARILLIEQIYRAVSIKQNHPYHN